MKLGYSHSKGSRCIAFLSLIFILFLSAFTGCSWWGSEDTLRLWDTGPVTLDPAISADMSSHYYVMQIFSGLVRLDHELNIVPDIAESYSDQFARVTNDGYAVDFANFYAMMYSEAFFEDDIIKIMEKIKKKYSSDTKVVNVVNNVTYWHSIYPDWRDTRDEIHDKYYTGELGELNGRFWWWVHSTHNFAATIMSLLYGDGDFNTTLQIASLAGWDNDCNAATAAGLIAALLEAQNIPHEWRYPVRDFYENTNRNPSVLGDDTLTNIANRTVNLGELIIEDNGGSITTSNERKFYNIPQRNYGIANREFSGLRAGTYTFTGYAVDTAGNMEQTETRQVRIWPEITPQPGPQVNAPNISAVPKP